MITFSPQGFVLMALRCDGCQTQLSVKSQQGKTFVYECPNCNMAYLLPVEYPFVKQIPMKTLEAMTAVKQNKELGEEEE